MQPNQDIPKRFIGSPLKVRTGVNGTPREIFWEGSWQRIEPILCWQDYGFAAGTHIHNWRTRRHRTCYYVKDGNNRVWEIYLDRWESRREWFMLAEVLNSSEG
jgi:hypothetical protein